MKHEHLKKEICQDSNHDNSCKDAIVENFKVINSILSESDYVNQRFFQQFLLNRQTIQVLLNNYLK